jgi:ABC-type multidrug transport system fused ATPase/permease subunit
MTFFETTAFGDILTHFSSDMYRVDDRIARFFNSMLSTRIRTAMMLLIMAWSKYTVN